MRFVVDAQLPPALARWIEKQGYEAEHVHHVGAADWPDRVVWQYARDRGAVILSKDEDFARRRAVAAEGPVILWLRIGNASSPDLLRWFEGIFPEAIKALERGEHLIELRRP